MLHAVDVVVLWFVIMLRGGCVMMLGAGFGMQFDDGVCSWCCYDP
jgi:hypothetical protein